MGLDPVVERMFQEKKQRGTGKREPDPDHKMRLKGELETPDLNPWVEAQMTTVMETRDSSPSAPTATAAPQMN